MRMVRIFLLCFLLTALALGIFSYKVFVLNYPAVPNEEAQSWRVEAKILFWPEYQKPIKVNMYRPLATNRLAIVEENIVTPDYGLIDRVAKSTGNRIATLSRRETRGQQVLFYQAVLYELTSSDLSAPNGDKPLPNAPYIPQQAEQVGADALTPLDTAMNSLIAEGRNKSSDNLSFTLELGKLLKQSDDRVNVLQTALPQASTLAAQLSALINAANIPARVVNGIILKEYKRYVPFTQWVEVYDGGKWHSIDVDHDRIGISDKHMPWWRGTGKMVTVENGHQVTTEISLKYNRESAITQAQWQSKNAAPWIASLSLFDLPIDTQLMFGIVLMIPIGGLIVVILRQLIGLPTFGTFMPVLIALSFRETGLLWGIALFGTIIFIGLNLRAYFDQLRLLVVPRLASVLTIVVLLIAVLTVISHKMGINAGLSITLFPMIILTMMIERMALMTEEFGARETQKTLLGSLLAATIAFVAMDGQMVRHLVFVFPELLLIILACTILMGRYNGYKLSEYFRFKKLAKAMAENHPASQAKE